MEQALWKYYNVSDVPPATLCSILVNLFEKDKVVVEIGDENC